MRDRLAAILHSLAAAVTVQAPSGEILYANAAAVRLLGFSSADELLVTPVAQVMERFEVFDETGRPLPVAALPGRAALRGETVPERRLRFRVRGAPGERWSVVRATPVTDERGEVVLAVNVFHDVTDRVRDEQRLGFLAEASELLSSSLEYESTLRTIAELAVPRLADWCVVYLLEDGVLRRLAVAHGEPELARWARPIVARSRPEDAARGAARVVATREPELIPNVTEEDLHALARNAEHLEVLRRIGLRSFMSVPLVARDEAVGAITFLSTTSGRVYSEDDLELATELARRAASAVENARLYRDSEWQRSRLALQHDVAGVLAQVGEPSTATRRIIETICLSLGWDAGAVWRVGEGGMRCDPHSGSRPISMPPSSPWPRAPPGWSRAKAYPAGSGSPASRCGSRTWRPGRTRPAGTPPPRRAFARRSDSRCVSPAS